MKKRLPKPALETVEERSNFICCELMKGITTLIWNVRDAAPAALDSKQFALTAGQALLRLAAGLYDMAGGPLERDMAEFKKNAENSRLARQGPNSLFN